MAPYLDCEDCVTFRIVIVFNFQIQEGHENAVASITDVAPLLR